MTMFLHSRSVMRSIIAFMPGMSVSQPSRPKRFAAVYLAAEAESEAAIRGSRQTGND
jgi:hypothetical protein